jgi:shikimate kinase
MAPNLILTGFMGTGKTTVGRLLAERLGWAFVDTDELIVAQDGRTITDIFAQDGELYFRELETAVSLELAAQSHLVISTGGRLLLDPVNADALLRNGRAFCLTAAPEEILQRIAQDGRRPLLKVSDPATRIRELLAIRAEAYGRYPQIQTDGKTAEQVVEEIITTCRD